MSRAGRVLLTGSSGFIGRALAAALEGAGRPLRCAVRAAGAPGGAEVVAVGDLEARPDWRAAVREVDVVVHCAARAHLRGDGGPDALARSRAVNRDATLALADAALEAGVRRLVFVSSIGVLGERTAPGHPFTAASRPAPRSAYAIAKEEAETGLLARAAGGELEVVIVRPPLVHGPGAPGNFGRLVRLVGSGWPLPLGGVENRRTFVGRENLVDLLLRTLDHPNAPGAPLLAGDARAISTAELVTLIARGMGRPARLFRAPGFAALGGLPGIGGAIAKLTESLEVDSSETRRRLEWSPQVSVEAGIAAMALGAEGGR